MRRRSVVCAEWRDGMQSLDAPADGNESHGQNDRKGFLEEGKAGEGRD